MRMNDYEKGLPRGRATRHVVGRFKWFMLLLVVVNIFLVYKLWDKNVELSNSEKSAEKLKYDVNHANVKHEKVSQDLMALEKRYQDLEKRSSEEVQSLNTKQEEINLLNERNSEMRKEIIHKETVVNELEKCTKELEGVKELAQNLRVQLAQEKNEKAKLQKDVEEMKAQILASQKSGNVPENEGDHDDKSHISSDKAPIVNEIHTDENADKTENIPDHTNGAENKEETEKGEDSDVIHDVDQPAEPPDESLVDCHFTQFPLVTNKCKFNHLPDTDVQWTVEQCPLIEKVQENFSDRRSPYLFVDNTKLKPEQPCGVFFEPIVTDQCIKMEITMIILGTATINILDNNIAAKGYPQKESDGRWVKEEIYFDKSDKKSHIIEINAVITSEGAVAISDIVITPVSCSMAQESWENDKNVHEEEEVEELEDPEEDEDGIDMIDEADEDNGDFEDDTAIDEANILN